MNLLRYFTTRDFVHIAAIVAAVYVLSFITKMTVGAIPFPGLKMLLDAFFASLVISVGLMWVKKIGTFTLIGLIYGIICGFIFPGIFFMFPPVLVGGIVGDITVKLLKGNYEVRKNVILACSICYFVAAFVIFYVMILMDYPQAILRHEVIFGIAVGCSVLAVLGSYLGTKIAGELRRAGLM